MATFSGINSYMNHIRTNFRGTLEVEVSNKNNELQQIAKQQTVYNSEPQDYERTYEFLYANKSIVLKKGRKNEIYLQTYTPTTLAYMPSRHSSWVDGSIQNKGLPFWIEYGNNSSLYSYEGRDYYSLAYRMIKAQLKSTITNGMKKRGIDIR